MNPILYHSQKRPDLWVLLIREVKLRRYFQAKYDDHLDEFYATTKTLDTRPHLINMLLEDRHVIGERSCL